MLATLTLRLLANAIVGVEGVDYTTRLMPDGETVSYEFRNGGFVMNTGASKKFLRRIVLGTEGEDYTLRLLPDGETEVYDFGDGIMVAVQIVKPISHRRLSGMVKQDPASYHG